VSLLAGKVALITGSSRGIGAAIAREFAKEGASVALHGRDRAAMAEVESAILREVHSRKRESDTGGDLQHRGREPRVIQTTGDVTSFADIEAMRAEIDQSLGPVDILVTNAGGSLTRPGPLEAISEEGWHASVNANLTATFLTIKSFLPGMKARKSGVIITMSSAAARRPHPQSPIPYAAAIAGIQMMTQHIAAQVGPDGIRVNCLAPETILTERNEQQIPEEQKTMLVGMHPIRRLGTPDDVARAAVYLASADAAWITGVILDISGGAVMS
jgi:3-oxoacyl-[acyl-carrier protein] reductase